VLLQIERIENGKRISRLETEIPSKIRSFQLKVFLRERKRNLPSPFSPSEMDLSTLRFPLHISRYNSLGHWQNKSAGARVGYERSNVCSTDRRVTTKPNTSEPFYKVNTMEPAKVYPRLNATSYFYSSNPSPFVRVTLNVSCAQFVTVQYDSFWYTSLFLPWKNYKRINSERAINELANHKSKVQNCKGKRYLEYKEDLKTKKKYF